MSTTKHTPAKALRDLVEALKSVSWSSWQTTAGFSKQLEAAEQLLAKERVRDAAPELLEVLLMVKEAAIDMRGEDFNLSTEQWAKFHAAIAKATGGAP